MFGRTLLAMVLVFAVGGQARAGEWRAESWVNGIKPGARYSFLQPMQSDLGAFHGVALEGLLIDWAAPGDGVGSGYGRVYFTMDLLYSVRGRGTLASYSGGLTLSLERNPMRDFLIPFWAIEIGGVTQKTTGKVFAIQPYLGFAILSYRRLTLDLAAGYLVTAGHFRQLHGLRARAGLTLSFW
jgi:hypothetical protein